MVIGLFRSSAYNGTDFDKPFFSRKVSISSTKQGLILKFTKYYRLSFTHSPITTSALFFYTDTNAYVYHSERVYITLKKAF